MSACLRLITHRLAQYSASRSVGRFKLAYVSIALARTNSKREGFVGLRGRCHREQRIYFRSFVGYLTDSPRQNGHLIDPNMVFEENDLSTIGQADRAGTFCRNDC